VGLVALGLLGLLSLDVALRLGASPAAGASRGEDAAASERLRGDLVALVSAGNRKSHERQWQAARWLAERCAGLGYEVRLPEYERKGERWPNVVASRVPLSTSGEHVLALAHIDSWSDDPQGRAPGADDNGSGLAVLLEVARSLRGLETERPLAFCFFSNEEVDGRGSQAFAAWARRQPLRIHAAVNVDVVGYNRPARLLDWSAVAAQDSRRGRARAMWLQARNAAVALRRGPGALLVAGRRRDLWLVDRVGGALERGSGLSVARQARDDCG
jgi:hypothetical protein